MKHKFKHNINYIALWIAIISFIIGTILLVSFKITDDFSFAIIGYYYIILAVFINALMVLLLLIHSVFHHKQYKEHLITIGFVLLNIPITCYYKSIAL